MDRIDAINWLVYEFGLDNWPDAMDKYVTGRMFGNWRFVDTLPTREIMFCNMIDRGISKSEVELLLLLQGVDPTADKTETLH